jgi:hypothetical protein
LTRHNKKASNATRGRKYLDDKYDIVFFWKSNDTGIYGRRQDMLVEYLSRSPGVNRIVHFDYPIPAGFLWSLLNLSKDRKFDQSNQIFFQTLSRLLRRKDSEKVKNYTFVHILGTGLVGRVLGLFLPKKSRYLKYIARVLSKNGIGARRTIFWVCPRNFDFPDIARAFEPDLIVADVIDDHRTWLEPDSPRAARLTGNYKEILEISDLVLANTPNLQRSMLAYSDDIYMIPNAGELLDAGETRQSKPKEIRKLQGPILGYVGNLSVRIDIDLLEHLAASRADWNIVLIGSVHLSKEILRRLNVFENVHFLGVKKYTDARRYIENFDVGIIPHLDNEMTRSMSPLKLYVYCSLNIPVVTTRIANLTELRDLVYVARDKNDFVEKVELALKDRTTRDPGTKHLDLMKENSWEKRAERILSLLDQKLRGASEETNVI